MSEASLSSKRDRDSANVSLVQMFVSPRSLSLKVSTNDVNEKVQFKQNLSQMFSIRFVNGCTITFIYLLIRLLLQINSLSLSLSISKEITNDCVLKDKVTKFHRYSNDNLVNVLAA